MSGSGSSRSRRTDFYDTPDYQNARGIAEALRNHIGTAWRLMHRERRKAVEPGPWSLYELDMRKRLATVWKQELLLLLSIRREGMR
jgi:hypothetical protein